MNHATRTRNATAADMSALLEMISELALYHGDQSSLTSNDLQSLAFSAKPCISIIVAERNSLIVGYIALYPLIQLQWAKKGMDIHHLFVKQGFRRQGIGRILVESATAEAAAQGCCYIAVGTHRDNAAAQGVYLACGFDTVELTAPRFRREI